ncbi:IS200/IS605 family transposase, partial [bacterium]|nr:IS200/IS605 family transposase [bacterium]
MPHRSFSKIYLHITWHTKENRPLIDQKSLKSLQQLVRIRCEIEREVQFITFGGYQNYVHLAVKIPPTLNISKWIGEIKGYTSHELTTRTQTKQFSWQEGYGVVSFSSRDFNMIVNYVENQEEHHQSN